MNSTWRDRPTYELCMGHREGALHNDEYDYYVPSSFQQNNDNQGIEGPEVTTTSIPGYWANVYFKTNFNY
jgi:hypothetical protein